MSGKLIVIEGLDGSGKATQSKLLQASFTQKNINSMQITFPDYESDSSALVKMYLAGTFGQAAHDVNAYAASCFYTVDRYASYKTNWGPFYHDGGLVIADRYTTSNAVHQCAKLPQTDWDSYLTWLFDFEYQKVAIPSPDLVIYLDVDPILSQQLMTQRYDGNEAKKDIHEKDVGYLQQSRLAAQYCAKNLGWKQVSCMQQETMRSIDEIHDEILTVVQEICE